MNEPVVIGADRDPFEDLESARAGADFAGYPALQARIVAARLGGRRVDFTFLGVGNVILGDTALPFRLVRLDT